MIGLNQEGLSVEDIDEVLEVVKDGHHTTAHSFIDDRVDLKRVSLVYREDQRIYAKLVAQLIALRGVLEERL